MYTAYTHNNYYEAFNGMCLFKKIYDSNCNGATVLCYLSGSYLRIRMPLECIIVIVLTNNLLLSAYELPLYTTTYMYAIC